MPYKYIILIVIIISFSFIVTYKLSFRNDNLFSQLSYINQRGEVSCVSNELTLSDTILLLYVNSECDYCSGELKQLAPKSSQYRIFIISHESPQTLSQWKELASYKTMKNVTIINDTLLEWYDVLEIRRVPTNYVINKNSCKKYAGYTNLYNILK